MRFGAGDEVVGGALGTAGVRREAGVKAFEHPRRAVLLRLARGSPRVHLCEHNPNSVGRLSAAAADQAQGFKALAAGT